MQGYIKCSKHVIETSSFLSLFEVIAEAFKL